MSKQRGRATNNFSSDKIPRKEDEPTLPTRRDMVTAGFEAVDANGEPLFHAIVTDTCTIGRDKDCNIVIRGDSKVSRKHARVVRREIAYFIRDLSSANGVFVNGTRLTEPYELKVGDEVEIGLQKWTFARKMAG
jgi:pSer/pThr/pTyr-binding forkhead associated (FHA) protein